MDNGLVESGKLKVENEGNISRGTLVDDRVDRG